MKEKLSILQHALGRDHYGEPRGGSDFRNHFCTGPGTTDYPVCKQLVEDKLMEERPGSALSGGDSVFVVTEAGKLFVQEHSPKRPPEPKLTKSQQRYKDYRRSGSSGSFREWIGADRRDLGTF